MIPRREVEAEETPRSGYAAALLGALLGALVLGVPIGAACFFVMGMVAFSDVDDAALIGISSVAAGATIVGAAWGTRTLLRRRALPRPGPTAVLLSILLGILFLVGVVSSGTEFQSDLFVPLTAVAPLMPLLARWVALRGIDRSNDRP